MPQSSNLLSFVPVPIPEPGLRLNSLEPAPRPASLEIEEDVAFRKIAEAALGATGAAGAALALRKNGAVVCVARAGEMAPPLGTRLDDSSGISGECLREGKALRCEDTETDPRVDTEACRALGLRSLAIAAIREGGQITGILEVFSPQPSTFSERHLEFLRQLAELVVESPEFESTGGQKVETQNVELKTLTHEPNPSLKLALPTSVVQVSSSFAPAAAVAPREERTPATQLPGDVNIAAYMAAHEKAQSHVHPRVPKIVLIGLATLLLAALTGWYLRDRVPRTEVTTTPSATTAPPNGFAPLATDTASLGSTIAKPSPDVSSQPAADQPESKAAKESLTNAASLDHIANAARRITKPIRVVRNEPSTNAESDVAPGLSFGTTDGKPNEAVSNLLNAPVSLPQRAPPTSQGVEGGELESKVAAIYPPQARAIGQHGTVVLEALVAEDGSVRDVKVVSGPPLLRQSAVDAVKRWRYKPFRLNGQAISAQTQVKLDFKLQ